MFLTEFIGNGGIWIGEYRITIFSLSHLTPNTKFLGFLGVFCLLIYASQNCL